MMTRVQLRGGPWDGETGWVQPESMKVGIVLHLLCETHGADPDDCDCGDALWYGYRLEPTESNLSFRPIRGDSSSS